jgi:hypothetical protein
MPLRRLPSISPVSLQQPVMAQLLQVIVLKLPKIVIADQHGKGLFEIASGVNV